MGNKTTESNQNSEETDTAGIAPFVMNTDTLSLQEEKKYIDDKESPSMTFNIQTVIAKGENAVEDNINQALTTLLFNREGMNIREAMKDMKDSINHDAEMYLKSNYDMDDEFAYRFKYLFAISGDFCKTPHAATIGYEKSLSTYSGGAHGMQGIQFVNFRKKDGSIITREEIFPEEKLSEVQKQIDNKLIKDNNCKDKQELFDKTAITMLGEVFVSENNFLLMKDSVQFVYNPYEIASYANGIIRVTVAYEQLKDAIRLEAIEE